MLFVFLSLLDSFGVGKYSFSGKSSIVFTIWKWDPLTFGRVDDEATIITLACKMIRTCGKNYTNDTPLWSFRDAFRPRPVELGAIGARMGEPADERAV